MYNEIRLDNKLYNITGKSFTKALEELDPDENYEGTPLSGLDAYERQLKRFDIKISGKGCDTVDKFFASAETAVLFPEFVKREITQGIDKYFALNRAAASVIAVDDTVYSSLSIESDKSSDSVAAGGTLPAITVSPSAACSLAKFARELKLTYEVIRKRRIDTFAVLLRQLGFMLAKGANAYTASFLSDAASSALTKKVTAMSYANLIDFWESLSDFEMDTVICSEDMFAEILQLDEIKNAESSGIATDGLTVTLPFGLKIISAVGLDEGTIIGVAKDFAYEMAVCDDLTVDVGKLISTQYDEIGASFSVGISTLNSSAIAKLTVSA